MKEFSLLSQVFEKNAALPARVFLPPGDDMGGVRLDSNDLLTAVDSVVENVHFRLDSASLSQVGRKSITRNLSDIAAMAARPAAALAAVVLPRHFSEDQALELFNAMHETAQQYNCPLIGGDIAMHDGPLICCVTVHATPGPGGVIHRGGAKAGDLIYVTGSLGGSLNPDGTGNHLTFEPRVELALKLSDSIRINAMIDISDGLGIDAGHIAAQSRVRLLLQQNAIPVTAGCDIQQALSAGEDYELLFTADMHQTVPDAINDIPMTRIGIVEQGSGTVHLDTGTSIIDLSSTGWEHHA